MRTSAHHPDVSTDVRDEAGLGLQEPDVHAPLHKHEHGRMQTLLADYQGAVMCNGYVVYQAVAKERPELVLCFCWAHVRREFWEARPAYPVCEEALDLIGALYAVERKLPAYTGLKPAERAEAIELRTELRKRESAPILEQLQHWAQEQQALPQSRLRKAITYLQTLWPGLCRFVEDGRLPLDNNAMERDLRGVVRLASFCTTPFGFCHREQDLLLRGDTTSALGASLAVA
jgi:hypothetical protein